MSKGASLVRVEGYKLGAVLGKGGFGTVYSALDEEKGGFYAIKQVSLNKIPKDQLTGIMQEIDLLKNLNHTNIVKYVKYIRTKDNLFIVLELVENGSLSSIIKKYGKFPEHLVCVYITQVLEGLVYLHEQGVVHRDIKGANILTTKEGVIKLADFGVAAKFGEESAAVVAGTPYWMAPEIIELNGSTTASDIWSVGCTVIELITGDPPYYDLGPMPALFRIVQDDYPALPEGISPALKDWLMQCFQKDPVLRITAEKLLVHKWIKANRKEQDVPEKNAEAIIASHNKKRNEKEMEVRQQAKNLQPIVPSASSSSNTNKTRVVEDDDEDWDAGFDGSIRLDKAPLNIKIPPKPELPNPFKNSNIKPKQKEEPKKSFVEEDDDDDWGDVATPKFAAKPLALKLGGGGGDSAKKPAASLPAAEGEKEKKDLKQWKEDDDDWDADFAGLAKKLGTMKSGTGSFKPGGNSIRSDISRDDVFDKFEDELDIDIDDEDAWVVENVYAKMNEETMKLMNKLQLAQAEDVILDASSQLIKIFKENPSQKSNLLRTIGVIPIMEMLEYTNPTIIHSILQVVNQIIADNVEIKENLCLVGGIPSIMKFSGRDYSLPIRLECAHFVSQMCSTSNVTLQMFIACRGLPVLVDMLSTSYQESKVLVWLATDSICNVFDLQSTTPKNDFCRLFSKSGLLPVLASVLRITAEDPDAVAKALPSKIANLFLHFSSADGVVKLAMSQQEVLAGIFDPLDHNRLAADVAVKLLKALKQLSMDHNTLSNMHRAGTIRRIVRVLARHDGPMVTDMHNHALNALFNLTKLDPERQFTAAQDGVVPHLMYIIESQSPLRQFALPLMCDLAHVRRARTELWKCRAVEFYLDLLQDKFWMSNALDSLSSWLIDDTDRVEKIISNPAQISKIVDAFENAEFNAFANMMEPLLHMITVSVKVNVGMGTSPAFVPKLLHRLTMQIPKAEVRVNLLRILTALYKGHPNPKKMIAEFNLYPAVKALTEAKIVLVQKLASQLLVAFNTNSVL